ncbi:MAG: NAD(P)H-binding protein [Actinobacteria bacterium]|nr:NAD(P)H-binding protein [Actinomycetota bacterium]
MKILVTGATGFIGPKVVHALRARDLDVRALVRQPERATQLAGWGVDLVRGDITDAAAVHAAAEGCTHVINLVAIIQGRPAEFHRVMTEGNRNLIAAAKDAGVERYVLMSALGTSDTAKDTVPYFGAKWAEERDVVGSGLEYTIFRPSFVFGRDGGALPTFMRQVKLSPLVTVIGNGQQRSQPIWVEDVAAYFAQGIDHPHAANRLFELGGPDTVDWNELYLTIARVLGKRRRLVHVPVELARTGARLTQRLPGAPLSADQVAMIEGADNVASDSGAVDTFKLPLLSLEEQIRRSS